MLQHRSSASLKGNPTNARERKSAQADDLDAAEVTDIIPFSEFSKAFDQFAALDTQISSAYDNLSAFEREARVIEAPELDDLNDTDDLEPVRLDIPSEFLADARDAGERSASRRKRNATHAYRDSHTDVSDGTAATDVIDMTGRRGAHRKETTGALKSRLMIAAMAAGATAAGAYSFGNGTEAQAADDTVLATGQTTVDGASVSGSNDGMQIVSVASNISSAVHAEEITKAAAFAQERAEREARLSRPLFVMPTKGVWTSGFGYRWGVLHGGIDIANSIGTPIYAASDGVVTDVGPTAGYGAWVKIRHSDGTVTLYGHINTWLVSVGERVMAGDQIATMGNRGYSTGPHLHFEVLTNGTNRIDPVGWLAKRGLSPGSYVG
ncbi:M23 family metallopeptidase [Mycolicibacterium smegmatis]|uniref:Peptidoglycan-binding LysM n=1 Tax=Mycolicibacterium smegmatis (strain MKD8) TaxID=1214915 RepID=A0A2U9PX24_MYCSE|nr:M23 family metallopeptidase [Mycolicibacterium smegmatis]AWT56359.1 peptidoglycan-binding LysM [Mycolicibacterium smegmatis MKD8]MCP2625905.1 M23 family metallopeptidase [Mycolicibacterium smegmatis]UGU34345.1 M23 family metallopeptidase [Mycolicibacterium smegmatis]ULN69180.1 M23 family metallopeptidase [Mycolicibacterium smegmatis]